MKQLFYINFLLFVVAAMVISCKDEDAMTPIINISPAPYPPSNIIHFPPNGGVDTVRNYEGSLRRLIEYQELTSLTFYNTLRAYNEEKLTLPGKGYPISDTIVGDWFKLITLDPRKDGGYYQIEVQPNLTDSTRLLVLWKDNYEKVAWWYQSDLFHGWECEPYFFIDQQDRNGNPEYLLMHDGY